MATTLEPTAPKKTGIQRASTASEVEDGDTCGIIGISDSGEGKCGTVILAVAHNEFESITASEIERITRENSMVYNFRHVLPPTSVTMKL